MKQSRSASARSSASVVRLRLGRELHGKLGLRLDERVAVVRLALRHERAAAAGRRANVDTLAAGVEAEALERAADERGEQQVLGRPLGGHVEDDAVLVAQLAVGRELDRVPQLLRL